jgi:hypothetical protein
MLLIERWLFAFALTLAIELLVVAAYLRRAAPGARGFSAIVIANVATHPAVWLIFPELGAAHDFPRWLTLTSSEVWAYGFEAFVYSVLLGSSRARVAIWASVVANTSSLVLGLLLRAFALL